MYKLVIVPPSTIPNSVIRTNEDDSITSIPFDKRNTDYQEYLEWVAEGNTPEPADE